MSLARRVGDVPLRALYTVGAVIAAVAAVVLVFMLFSGDKPRTSAQVGLVDAAGSGSPTGTPTPTPVKVPPVPTSKGFPALPGKASVIKGSVVDEKAGITYANLGEPWVKASVAAFTSAQRAGGDTPPRALIASRPLPGAVPASLTTAAQYRKLAVRVAKWTLRYQPPGTELTWTGSQPLPGTGQLGWLLEYQLDYIVGETKHSSEAIVAVVGTAKERPGVLFATVPDSRKTLYRDLGSLLRTVRRTG